MSSFAALRLHEELPAVGLVEMDQIHLKIVSTDRSGNVLNAGLQAIVHMGIAISGVEGSKLLDGTD